MEERLNEDLKNAMREKDTIALNAIRSIKTALVNRDTAKGAKKSDIDIVKMLANQRKEAIAQYTEAGSVELADTILAYFENLELEIIERYLPKQLSKDDVYDIVKLYIDELEDKSMKQMGGLMKRFNSEYPGQDGKIVSTIIKEQLLN